MKKNRPPTDPDERVFTIADVKKLFRRQRKSILKASLLGAALLFSFYSITLPPSYAATAMFREGAQKESSGGGSSEMQKLLVSFGGGSSSSSQTMALMQSQPVLKPLSQKFGLQAAVVKGGLLSKIYARMRDNLRAERACALPEVDWFAFQDVVYEGEETLSYGLIFETPESFSLVSGKEVPAKGSIGTEVRLPEVCLTLINTPSNLRLKHSYSLKIHRWDAPLSALRKNLQISEDKTADSIYRLKFQHRNRRFSAAFLNALMEQFRFYLKKEHDDFVKEQLEFLQKRQDEISENVGQTFFEYETFMKENFNASGHLGMHQKIETLSKSALLDREKILEIEREQECLGVLENEKKLLIPLKNSFTEAAGKILYEIADLTQQGGLIELALQKASRPPSSEEQYEARQKELKSIRKSKAEVSKVLHALETDSLDPLFDPDVSLFSWALSLGCGLSYSDKKDLSDYLAHSLQLLSMEESFVEKRLSFEKEAKEFQGIDLKTLQQLYFTYNQKLDEYSAHQSRLASLKQEVLTEDFEISSLSPVLTDVLSQRLIEQAGSLAIKVRDEKFRTAKEGSRWTEDLILQKRILADHLDQLHKIESVKAELAKDRIESIQKASLSLINGNICVLEKRFYDAIQERRTALELEKRALEKSVVRANSLFEDFPEKWRKEKWIDLKSRMGIEMVQSLTQLVESKSLGNHLHRVQSKALDQAVLPQIPCKPGLFPMALMGAFLGGFAVFSLSFMKTLFKGFPTSVEKLKAMRYPVFGNLSPLCVNKEVRGSDLELFRKLAFFFDLSSQGKVISLISGSGPDYSFSLAEHLVKMLKRSLVLRCDFGAKFHERDLPGLLQFWRGEIEELPIRSRNGYDFVHSGGFTPYGVEILHSKKFEKMLQAVREKYDFVFLVLRSPIDSVESLSPLKASDQAVLTVGSESTEQLTPYVDWAYDEGKCRLALITSDSKGS